MVAKEIELVMNLGESAICLEERWVAGDSLVQQIDCLQQFCSGGTAKTCQKKVLGVCIKTQSGDVARRGMLDFALFIWRKICIKLVVDRPYDLVLNCEDVTKHAVIALST